MHNFTKNVLRLIFNYLIWGAPMIGLMIWAGYQSPHWLRIATAIMLGNILGYVERSLK